MSSPLTLIATITALPGHAQALEAGLRQLVPPSQAEAGCLQYNLHRHQDQPNRFIMVEQWLDAAALSAHQQTAHFKHFVDTCGSLLEPVDHQLMHRIL
ncbi:putative quinol monooxygenase [Pseudomonas leptonychotis]|uniref:Antibiotic biosynthesis monooxygenase n=1 Tax=Pseudomonas leptonychotis TaxID=2448482 RepID=A0A4T1ZVL6_9PSED|nr:putative quinol monooxygenase [Pseudomonas leptonychotis]TIH07549.1 antibiotic biosynthesis monooxygenase [Pseudomonas leptonychotis]